MIVTKSLPYETIKKQLKKSDKIGIISCNTCVRICGTGGEKALNRLALKLKKDGFKVVDKDLIGSPCDRNQLQKNQLHGNVQIVLACDAGVYNLRKIFPKHKIIPGLKTIGIGVNNGGKNIEVVKEIK
jgi:ferredoxin